MELVGAYSGISGCLTGPFVVGFDAFTLAIPNVLAGDLVVCSAKPPELNFLVPVAGSWKVFDNDVGLLNLSIPIGHGVAWALHFEGSFSGNAPSEHDVQIPVYTNHTSLPCVTGYLTTYFEILAVPDPDELLRVQVFRATNNGPPVSASGAISGADYATPLIYNHCFESNGLPPCAPNHAQVAAMMSYKVGMGTVTCDFGGMVHIAVDPDTEHQFGADTELHGWGILTG